MEEEGEDNKKGKINDQKKNNIGNNNNKDQKESLSQIIINVKTLLQ
jgi:hypothetical protein